MLSQLTAALTRRAGLGLLRSPAAPSALSRAPAAAAVRFLHLSAPAASAAASESPSPPLVAEPTRFAIVHLSGKQYKVAPDDLICVEKLDMPVGTTFAAKRVLLVGEAGATVIGSPLINDASVHATVEEQGYGKKVIVFKKKRRKGYRRWKGYRSRLTLLRINSIDLPPDLEAQLGG
jgi:large subunit ribosomal protein L21